MARIVEVVDTITLVNQTGRHNKFYTISVVRLDDGKYEVPFAYGRIGNAPRYGTKGTFNMYATASNKYADIVSEKRMQKGYSAGTTMYAPTANGFPVPTSTAPASNTPPPKPKKAPAVTKPVPLLSQSCQLLTEIDKDRALELVQDPDYCAQEKHDGKRMKLVWSARDLEAVNRKGLICSYPRTYKHEFEVHLDTTKLILDGEQVGDHYWTWDIMSLRGMDLRQMPYRERIAQLEYEASTNSEFIHVVETAYTTLEKAALFQALIEGEKEGIVFKKLDAPYTDGKGGPQYKYKFYATASCIVLKQNQKRSVELGVLDGSTVVPVGNCTIPPNKDVPAADAIVEVRYLYAYKGGSLYQPTYLEPRDDIDRDECVIGQLKYKAAA